MAVQFQDPGVPIDLSGQSRQVSTVDIIEQNSDLTDVDPDSLSIYLARGGNNFDDALLGMNRVAGGGSRMQGLAKGLDLSFAGKDGSASFNASEAGVVSHYREYETSHVPVIHDPQTDHGGICDFRTMLNGVYFALAGAGVSSEALTAAMAEGGSLETAAQFAATAAALRPLAETEGQIAALAALDVIERELTTKPEEPVASVSPDSKPEPERRLDGPGLNVPRV